MKQFNFISLLILLLQSSILVAQTQEKKILEVPKTHTFPGIEAPAFPYAQPEEVGLSSKKLHRLGGEIISWIINGELVGAELLIVKEGKAVFHEVYGWSDLEERLPMQRNSIFSVMSMSKPFTATAILMLKEDGKLKLDDTVINYVPAFSNDSTTIQHLLTHTSGYAYNHGIDGENGARNFNSLEKWVEFWATVKPSEPFNEYSYSDFNYALLGYIVEKINARPVEEYIKSEILTPLELGDTHTTFSPEVSWAKRMNSRHRWDEQTKTYERYWSNKDPWPWSFFPAGWGMFSTAMDYATFLTMWMNKGNFGDTVLLSERSVEQALIPYAKTPFKGYGYGWFLRYESRSNSMSPIFYHGGWDGTMAIALPSEEAILIYMTQSRGTEHRDAFWNRLGRLEIFDHPGPYDPNFNYTTKRVSDDLKLTAKQQLSYLGTYRYRNTRTGNELVVKVWEEENRMNIRFGGEDELTDRRYHLVPEGEHHFSLGRYKDSQLEALSSVLGVRFTMKNKKAVHIDFLARDQIQFTGTKER